MRCKRLDDLLPAYLDGGLPARLNQRVSDHLDACERCRQELAAQQRALRSLDAGRRPVCIDLWADFSRRLQAQAPPRPSPWRLFWQPGLAAALAAAAVALIAGTAPKPSPAPAHPQAGTRPPPRLAQVAHLPDRETDVTPPPSLPHSGEAGMKPLASRGRQQPSASPGWAAAEEHVLRVHPLRPSSRRAERRRAFSARAIEPGLRSSSSHIERATVGRPETPAVLRQASFPTREGRPQGAPLRGPDLPPAAPASVAASPAAPHHASSPADGARAGAGDPLKIAEALVSVEQDAASDQMKGELLRLAREVARLGGEAGPADSSGVSPGGLAPADNPATPSPSPAGT